MQRWTCNSSSFTLNFLLYHHHIFINFLEFYILYFFSFSLLYFVLRLPRKYLYPFKDFNATQTRTKMFPVNF